MIPASLRRPWGSRLIVALAPFAAACGIAAMFVSDLERAMVQILPVVCVGIFWRWPTGLRRQLLTLVVVPLAVMSAIEAQIGLPQGNLILFLVAGAAEIWLWRSSDDVVPSPDAQGAQA